MTGEMERCTRRLKYQETPSAAVTAAEQRDGERDQQGRGEGLLHVSGLGGRVADAGPLQMVVKDAGPAAEATNHVVRAPATSTSACARSSGPQAGPEPAG